MNVDKNARSRLAVESGQTVGTLRMRVEGYDDQGSRKLPIYFPPSFSAASGWCLGRFNHLCLRRDPTPINPARKGEANKCRSIHAEWVR